MKVAVCGAGGFIGGHTVGRLVADGHEVRAFDIKPLDEWWQVHSDAHSVDRLDLSRLEHARTATSTAEWVVNLAASMGGMNFIEHNKLECMLNVLINTHLLMAADQGNVSRYFFSGSACCYSSVHQDRTDVPGLREEDAYPAMAEDGYGWEKLFSERMCEHFNQETDMLVRTARFHNVYGTGTSFDDLRGKAPASLSRKVATAELTGDHVIPIWGDGLQTRSFMWVDDCVEGVMRMMALEDDEYAGPMNLGSAEMVSINDLVSLIEEAAFGEPGVLERQYDVSAPTGVRGRSSNNEMCLRVLGWEPKTSLREGIAALYPWVRARVAETMS